MREELQIVLQHDEIALADLCVGGIRILHIDRAVPQRFVAESVIDADDVLRRELILIGERSPAVAPIEKFVGESEFQFRMVS